MLQVKDLGCQIQNRMILEAINFSVGAGEILTVLGGSGSGKTTLLRCLCGLLPIHGGQISLSPRKDQGTSMARANFGLVPQGCCLFENMTVKENLAYGLRQIKKMAPAEADHLAMQWLERFTIEHRAAAYPSQISGGQRQRVAIARALVLDPQVLLFDEPTSALDPEMTQDVVNLIHSVARGGVAVIVVTHDMDVAKKLADGVLFLENGRIVERGTGAEFFQNPQTERAKKFLSLNR